MKNLLIFIILVFIVGCAGSMTPEIRNAGVESGGYSVAVNHLQHIKDENTRNEIIRILGKYNNATKMSHITQDATIGNNLSDWKLYSYIKTVNDAKIIRNCLDNDISLQVVQNIFLGKTTYQEVMQKVQDKKNQKKQLIQAKCGGVLNSLDQAVNLTAYQLKGHCFSREYAPLVQFIQSADKKTALYKISIINGAKFIVTDRYVLLKFNDYAKKNVSKNLVFKVDGTTRLQNQTVIPTAKVIID